MRRAAGQLGRDEEAELDRHIADCSRCYELGIELARALSSGPGGVEDTVEGFDAGVRRIGRFVLLRPIGAGAMGVVYAAYDEELERRVAIKVLRPGLSETAEARVLREARAMARLTHPNIVQVYEIGEHGGVPAIAMEFIKGRTLCAWRDSEHRTWRELLDAYQQAGEGLSAAHAVGVIHRDFKPHNAMIAEDGVVKVVDFGLARHGPGPDIQESKSIRGANRSGSSSRAAITATGGVVGTPGYMAPEQFAGAVAGAAADQFAFCVALWEALYGERPFAGTTSTELHAAIVEGPAPRPPGATAVPDTIAPVLLRGLAVSPAQRYSSMRELLDALEPEPRRTSVGWWVGGAAVLGACTAGLSVWLLDRPELCTDTAEHLVDVWDEPRRAVVEGAMIGTEFPTARHAWTHARTELDAYAAAWIRMHRETCEATSIRGDQSVAVMDLRMACLQRARVELDAVVGVLETADAEVVQRSHDVVDGLPPLSHCADLEGLQADIEPPDPSQQEAVQAIRRQLAEAKAQLEAGRYATAQATVSAAAEAMNDVSYAPVQAELAYVEALVLTRLGLDEAAARSLERTVELAGQTHQWDLMGNGLRHLVYVLGVRQKRTESLQYVSAVAQGLSTQPQDAAKLANNLGGALQAQGKYAEAEAEHRRALALWTKAPGRDVATLRDNLGAALERQGKYAEAEAEHRRALALFAKALGSDHPRVAASRNNLGITLERQGKHAEAEAEHRRALALWTKALGHDHRHVANSRNNLGGALQAQGKYAEAEAEHRRALALWTKALGPDHPDVAKSRNNLGGALQAQGKYAEAEAEYRRALALRIKALGHDHPDVALSRSNLGIALERQGKHAEAEAEYRRAVALFAKALGHDHPHVAASRNNLANVLQVLGRQAEAEVELRQTLALWTKALGPDHPHVATSRNNLANVLQALGKHAEAETEYRQALALGVNALGPDHPDVADTRSNLASLLLEQGAYDEAAREGEQAWARLQRDDIPPRQRAFTAFVLCRALWNATQEAASRQRARALAEQAARDYRSAGPAHAEDLDAVEAWLAEHLAPAW